jgi:hypothetical protein
MKGITAATVSARKRGRLELSLACAPPFAVLETLSIKSMTIISLYGLCGQRKVCFDWDKVM